MMWQQELGRAPAVIAGLVHAAAAGVEESVRQRAGMVQPAGRGPAIGAAEDRRAVLGAHALLVHQPQRHVPFDLDVTLDAAQLGRRDA